MEAIVQGQPVIECKTLAAIDIGSNSIRMVLGQLLEDGRVEVLESYRKAARLGQDTFTKRRLSRSAIRTVISILREYQKVIELYDVKHVRAVATSAVREAFNADILIDRVATATGLCLEVIDPSEESRLTVTGVQSALGKSAAAYTQDTLFAEVGGGSTILTVLKKGHIVVSQSMSLGSIRLLEDVGEIDLIDSKVITNEITNILPSIENYIPIKKIHNLFILGADARFAAVHAGKKLEGTDLHVITKAKFIKLVDKVSSMTPDRLAEYYDIEFTDAETLNAALVVYKELLNSTKAKQLMVSLASLRDGLLRDLARRASGEEDKVFADEVISSAMGIADKYKANVEHCRRVRMTAVRLFDALKNEHRLSFRERVFLEAAAIMHEIGIYVSPRGFHKHSCYLIRNSEIFGFTQSEISVVANIARYHRRARPKTTHNEYMSLARENRTVVNKLAALLRLAEAMDTGRNADPEHTKFEVTGDSLVVSVPRESGLSLKRRNFAAEKEMFEDIYGLNALLEERL